MCRDDVQQVEVEFIPCEAIAALTLPSLLALYLLALLLLGGAACGPGGTVVHHCRDG